MNYLSVAEFAEKNGVSDRYIRRLCAAGKLEAQRSGRAYRIPETAELPADHRHLRGKVVAEHLVSLFAGIDARKAELGKRRPLTPGEVERLRDEFMVNYTYNSNAIEGNTLTLQETALVLQGLTVDRKPLKDHLEAVGHRDAFLYIQELAKRRSRLREHEIRSIHTLVLMDKPEDRGVYRRVPVTIVGAYTEPVQPYMIAPKMEELLRQNEERKKTMHPVERIARFHLEFEGIHPFIDGNGRTGRLIMNLELIRSGYLPINVKFADRKRYYEAFDAYYRDGQADAMILLIGEYVRDRLEEVLAILA
jgi:excisionase family DNA binding protein